MSNHEEKKLPFVNIKAESSGRIRVGIAAVSGNIDDGGDRIQHGAFAKTITEGFNRVQHLWNHDYTQMATAKILELKEITRDELPSEVLAKAPDATGGLWVKREYIDDDWSNAVLKRVDAGIIKEMSFAYDVIKSTYSTEPIPGTDKTREIRELLELKLWDTSDVPYGMNGATMAAGAKSFRALPLGALLTHLKSHLNDFQSKAGSRNSASDAALIENIHAIAVDLGATCAAKTDDAKNSDSAENQKAEAAPSTSLSKDWLDLQKLELANLSLGD